jgi:ribose transport system permease protein
MSSDIVGLEDTKKLESSTTGNASSRRVRLPSGFTDVFGRYWTIISLVALIIMFSAMEGSSFASTRNLLSVLNEVSILAVMASGLTVCLAMGLFDLSVGAAGTFGGFVVAKWAANGTDKHFILVLLFAIIVSVAIGLVNGLVVGILRVNAFIATLATGSILTGLVLGYSQSQTISMGLPSWFLDIGQAKVGAIPMPVVIMVVVMVLLWIMLERTQTGRHIYAVGGNAAASRLAGIRILRYVIVAFVVAAATAVLAGTMANAIVGSAPPSQVGEVYLLNAYAAAFLGAATIRRGKFHIVGTGVGVLLLGVISNGLSIAGAPSYWQDILSGALVILAVFVSGLVSRVRGTAGL